jgi:type IV secretory pathway VirB6-like protein
MIYIYILYIYVWYMIWLSGRNLGIYKSKPLYWGRSRGILMGSQHVTAIWLKITVLFIAQIKTFQFTKKMCQNNVKCRTFYCFQNLWDVLSVYSATYLWASLKIALQFFNQSFQMIYKTRGSFFEYLENDLKVWHAISPVSNSNLFQLKFLAIWIWTLIYWPWTVGFPIPRLII